MAEDKKEKIVAKKQDSFRLPKTVIPINYALSLEPDLESKTFNGEEEIEIDVFEPVNHIILNAKELEISQAYVKNSADSKLDASISFDTEKQFAIFTFKEALQKGKWKLYCKFKGILNDKLKGFYNSTWTDESGHKHQMVTSQLESTDARRVFPCFDEPEFKATYEVTLIVPKHLAALSNGRILNERVDQQTSKKTVRFRKTMKMSTYLLAFIVGELEPSESIFVHDIDVRAWTVPGKRDLTRFALRCAAFTINYFEKYFRVGYPDPDKCDLIAIPDFAAGAMENKDCITFRESALLVDETTATHAELERVADVVMHELAHMWFGDLVTMRWWNGLWLNEAFATFMAAKCLNAFKPEWKVWDNFGIGRAAAARTDALKSTRPIECTVNRPEEAQELFDVISYQKGCSVLYQIEQFIGEEVFRNGITRYLNKHAFANTETSDLWDSLESACRDAKSDIPVRKIMDDWVFKAGHPVLSVSEGKSVGSVQISQSPFRFLKDSNVDETYLVPVTMKVRKVDGSITMQKFLLKEKTETVNLGDNFDWVVINAAGSGFYRVSYAPELIRKLTTKVQENLSVIERFNLVNDSWAAVRAGIVSAENYLEMIKLFSEESDINVWSIILSSLHTIRSLLKGEGREGLKKIIHELCHPLIEKLGWVPADEESVQTKQVRGSLIGVLGTIGENKAIIEHASQAFDDWKKDKTSIDSNLLPAIVNTLAFNGDQSRYNEFRQMSKEAKTPQEILRFLYALAAFRDLKLLRKTMDSCLSEDVRTQDAPFLFASIINNEISTEAAWRCMQDKWDAMVKAYPDTSMVRLCSSAIPSLDTPPLEKEAQDFFAKHKVKSGDMAVAQALEQLRVNVLLRERESERLANYIQKSTNKVTA